MSISEIKNHPAYMTEKSLKSIGISRKLWEDWFSVVNEIWESFTKDFNGITCKENIIHVKDYEIKANFVNSSYIEVVVDKKKTEMLSVRLTDTNLKEIPVIVFLTIGKDINDLSKRK